MTAARPSLSASELVARPRRSSSSQSCLNRPLMTLPRPSMTLMDREHLQGGSTIDLSAKNASSKTGLRPTLFILSKTGVQTIWTCCGQRRCGPLAHRTLTRYPTTCGASWRESNKRAHNTVDSLRAAILEAVANMDKEFLIKACIRFRARLEAVVKAGSGWFEFTTSTFTIDPSMRVQKHL